MRHLLRGLAEGALDLVFAPVCAACRQPIPTSERERLVCRICWARCRTLPPPRCERCWGPVPPWEEPRPKCRSCDAWPAAIRAVRSAFVVDDVSRELVHALKYRGWEAVAAPMATRMAAMEFPRDVRDEARIVVPVPTTRERLRERGYNQAALLGAGFAERTGRRSAPELLERRRAAGSQTSLHPGERRANVAGAFVVPTGCQPDLRGEHLLLVDDVWTTGATALACSEALLASGARIVSVATFARVVPELERRGA